MRRNESIEVFLPRLSEDELHFLNGIRKVTRKSPFIFREWSKFSYVMCPEPTVLNFVVKCGNLFFPMMVLLRSNDPIFTRLPTKLRKGNVFSHVCLSVMSCLCVHRTCRLYMLLNEQVWTCSGGGAWALYRWRAETLCRKGEGAGALYMGQLTSYRNAFL